MRFQNNNASFLLSLVLGSLIVHFSLAFAIHSTPLQQHASPRVIVIGGGPGGLIVSILLNNIGINTTVLEEARGPDEWSSKSYAMSLNERGKAALDRAGCLESAMRVGNEKTCSYFVDGITGDIKTIPRREDTPSLGLSRPLLVECIEGVATDLSSRVTLRKGAGCSHVTEDGGEPGLLRVHLEDGAVISGATHVVGADGKWSNVRQSFPELDCQANLVSCTGFGVLMFGESIPKGFEKNDGTYVIFPPTVAADNGESPSSAPPPPPDFYIIASHLANGGGMSIAMVCSDNITKKYPWLQPEADPKPNDLVKGGWEDEISLEKEKLTVPIKDFTNDDLANKLERLFHETVPAFHAILDKRFYKNARINRRASWLQMSPAEGTTIVSYSTEEGNVALVGDAAHAMTASMGEGGNCAMESAVKLVDAVILAMEEKGETDCTVDTMNEAFLKYGTSRPREVQPVQEMSAARNNK